MKRLTADDDHWYVDLTLEPQQMRFVKTVYLTNPSDARRWSYVDNDYKALVEKQVKDDKAPKKSTSESKTTKSK